MKVNVLYHDHCFDGAASAAFFSRFLEEKFHPGAEFHFTGLAHKASQLFEDSLFDAGVNAIVDFKYSPDPRLTWWFDHHQSAFLSPEDAEHYRKDGGARHLFFDPDYRSCTMFIRDITKARFDYEAPDLEDLVKWADIIDGAQYANASEAVEMAAPAMKLVLVIEAAKGSGIVHKIIRLMRRHPLEEILRDAEIQSLYQPLHERHRQSIGIIRQEARCQRGVIYFDLTGYDLEGYNKFIPYYLFPESTYTVSISNSSFRTKVSVGSNPWARQTPSHNLASICERYGGGGHPRVGAISFPIGAVGEARRAAAEIAAELRA